MELSSNRIKQAGAVALARGLVVNIDETIIFTIPNIFNYIIIFTKKSNFVLEEINLSNNTFGVDGGTAMSECIKYNKMIKSIDLSNNRLNYDATKCIAESLGQNSTIEMLNVLKTNCINDLKKKYLFCF